MRAEEKRVRIELDMYQTMAVAVLALMLGRYLRKKCWLLERFCIPAPVIGGVIFAVATCICYVTGIAEFVFDDILKEVFMVFFFTSVGFQANLKVLKSGGKSGGLRNFRSDDGLYGGSDVWPGGRQRDGRTARRTAG